VGESLFISLFLIIAKRMVFKGYLLFDILLSRIELYIERKNRVIEEMARSMLKGKRLPNKFWVEAWYKQKHDVSHLKVFGIIAYALIPSQSRDKFDKKGERLIFIGYSDESKGFQLFNLRNDQLLLSRDVIFLNLQLGNGKIQLIQNQQHWSYLKSQSSLMFPILLLKIKLVQILRMMEAHQVLMKNQTWNLLQGDFDH